MTSCGWAKGPEPARSIALEPLGFQTPLTQFMLAGSSMLTIDFVDNNHVLLTYSAKRLLKRLPECPQGDQDREVDAVMLELPAGKVMARASWRTHDHGQYLWNLGQGRFMLRIRDTLSTFAPMANLPKGDAFLQTPFIRTDRRIGAILLSPETDLMILETMDPPRPEGEEPKLQEKPVQINFIRLLSSRSGEVEPKPGGAIRVAVPGRIPANAAGFVAILDQGQQHWAFNFQTYGGKVKELAAFDSTCRPVPILVSRSEFIAFGCHLSHTPQVVGAFNMRGEEMWEQNLTESYVSPMFAYAPESGRFALSRVLTRSSLVDSDMVTPELFEGQSITVYQTDSGRQLLRVDANPIARAGQNFSLSPDGMKLAVIRENAIEIFQLPALTPKERQAVQTAAASAPQIDGDPALALASNGQESSSSTAASQKETPQPVSVTTPEPNPAPVVNQTTPTPASASEPSSTDGSKAAAATGQENESQPEQPRKPPTLYAPGESHESGTPKQTAPK
ncbi:hypothetical protein [Edaphobacter albus]|uniref:hypothetical protein n=1 Tax=Edaphobacter sp. 4G125 TaxID=2763071 RepID=UPI001645824F|nr:hypothetical protein [Edaphobacter sp. 4G125]QNI36513.1 hypothetical protein H7846_16395 [Edaphobacter sp. 4G125]